MIDTAPMTPTSFTYSSLQAAVLTPRLMALLHQSGRPDSVLETTAGGR